MHHRSYTTRSLRAGWARNSYAWLALALAVGALAGCQTNSDRDLIARERRLQEDQIYALQDYVMQYQRLLCQVRQENHALRQQLAEGVVINSPPSEPPSRLRNGRGPTNDTSPKFQTPKTPGVKQQQPDTAPPEIDVPDVPPLKSTTSDEAEPAYIVTASVPELPNNDPSPQVLTASYEGPVPPAPSRTDDETSEPPAPAETSPIQPTSEILLRGEVVANEDGGGPRLAIEVVLLDGRGRGEPFEGNVSLMLLAPKTSAAPQNLGRWDYGPDDVQAAVTSTSGEPSMRFYIELPKQTPQDTATELWVRLVSHEGAKRLAHAKVELSRPGVFSSDAHRAWPQEQTVIAAGYTEPLPPPTVNSVSSPPSEAVVTAGESKWAVALPGQPANLPPDVQGQTGSGGWKAASEPIPVAIATSRPALPKHEPNNTLRPLAQPLSLTEPVPPAAVRAAVKKQSWSPERGREDLRRMASRPGWSATR